MTAGILEIERRVLAMCAKRDRRASEFPKLKPVLDRLVKRGDLRRATAPGESAPMLVIITDSGRERLARLARVA